MNSKLDNLFYGKVTHIYGNDDSRDNADKGNIGGHDRDARGSFEVILDVVQASSSCLAPGGAFDLDLPVGQIESNANNVWDQALERSRQEHSEDFGSVSRLDTPFDELITYDFILHVPKTQEQQWLKYESDEQWISVRLDKRVNNRNGIQLIYHARGELSQGAATAANGMSMLTLGQPDEVYAVRCQSLPKTLATKLGSIFNISHVPIVNVTDARAKTWKRPLFDQAISFNIGQGSCIGLASDSGEVGLYYDVGWSICNKQLTPFPHYCTCEKPAIILSHWDKDHWHGVKAEPSLLSRHWVVSANAVGGSTPQNSRLAFDILSSGGRLTRLDISAVGHLMVPISAAQGSAQDQELYIVQCQGTTRNDSGFALFVYDHPHDVWWELTGDASYDVIPPISSLRTGQDDVVGLTMSHHGGKLSSYNNIPSRPNNQSYARVLVSFGAYNSYGPQASGATLHGSGDNHPRRESLQAFRQAGWQWDHTWPGLTMHSGDALATSLKRLNRPVKTPVANNHIAMTWDGAVCANTHFNACVGGTVRY